MQYTQWQPEWRLHSSEFHAERLGLPPITERNASAYPPPSLKKFQSAASREPADSPPALWYWQMTTQEWEDRDSESYKKAKDQHRNMLAEIKQRKQQHEKARPARDRSSRNRPSNSERRKQRNEQVMRKHTAAVITSRRDEQPWYDRRDLFAQLLKAAFLPTRHLFGGCSHLYVWSNFSCSVPGGPCIHDQMQPLSTPDSEWVHELVESCDVYMQFLKSNPGRRPRDNDDEWRAYNIYSIAPASRHVKGEGLTLDEAKRLQLACEDWLCVRRAPFVHYLLPTQRAAERCDKEMRAFQRLAARRPCDPDGPFIEEWWANLVVGRLRI